MLVREVSGLGGRESSVRGLRRENETGGVGAMVFEEEERKSGEKDGMARVEVELRRLRELYPVRERERTPVGRVGEGRGQWGTPGSLYDRDGFLRE